MRAEARSATSAPRPDRVYASDVAGRLAIGDIDNDGDVDACTNNDGPARLLLNQTIAGQGIRLPHRGTPNAIGSSGTARASGNRFGIGARVGVVREGQPTLWRRARTDGSYLSASDDRVHFGLGTTIA